MESNKLEIHTIQETHLKASEDGEVFLIDAVCSLTPVDSSGSSLQLNDNR